VLYRLLYDPQWHQLARRAIQLSVLCRKTLVILSETGVGAIGIAAVAGTGLVSTVLTGAGFAAGVGAVMLDSLRLR
jgi:hypothetical protein